jgi:predicted metal-dependent HD superfamily phosphohydrolase
VASDASAEPESGTIATPDRWRRVCSALGVAADTTAYRKLIRAYGGWNRRYHSVEHLEACLLEFDLARAYAEREAEVETALWFHDAIYRTRARDNEERSAEWARRWLSAAQCEPDAVERIVRFILATKHVSEPLRGDAALVVDVDLSILGQPEALYDGFEKKVRREYWWVPRGRYKRGRSLILRSFLERPTIYQTEFFRRKYERQARSNLARALAALAE